MLLEGHVKNEGEWLVMSRPEWLEEVEGNFSLYTFMLFEF